LRSLYGDRPVNFTSEALAIFPYFYRIDFFISRVHPFILTRFAAEVICLISVALSAEVVVIKNLFFTVSAGNYHCSCSLIAEGGESRNSACSLKDEPIL
jgi:hypothetical protein